MINRLRRRRGRNNRTPLTVTHVGRLSTDHAGDELVSVSIGPDGEAVALWAGPADAAVLQDREVAPSGASFAVDRLDEAVTVRVSVHTPRLTQQLSIPGLRFTYPVVQPMPGGAFLVVGPRVRRGTDGTPPNAVVYDAAGQVVAEGLLGDGIEHVQATPSGNVWVGYFDEGVYGNFGWGDGPGTEPIGSDGLLRFTPELTLDWRYHAEGDTDPISDCYALNVAGESAWACYYTGFPLIAVRRDEVRSWRNTVEGASAIAVHEDRVALYGGYGENSDRLVIGRIGADAVEVEREHQVVLPGGSPISAIDVSGRGSTLNLFAGPDWYRLDLADLVG
ncbi:hypothetical protein [Kribbella sp. NPDC049227]|uniref:hypothetical protein n=1 Tax=Kribbella sp. NPDC049227 TaxID=3364113 RepID=UPI00371B0F30